MSLDFIIKKIFENKIELGREDRVWASFLKPCGRYSWVLWGNCTYQQRANPCINCLALLRRVHVYRVHRDITADRNICFSKHSVPLIMQCRRFVCFVVSSAHCTLISEVSACAWLLIYTCLPEQQVFRIKTLNEKMRSQSNESQFKFTTFI